MFPLRHFFGDGKFLRDNMNLVQYVTWIKNSVFLVDLKSCVVCFSSDSHQTWEDPRKQHKSCAVCIIMLNLSRIIGLVLPIPKSVWKRATHCIPLSACVMYSHGQNSCKTFSNTTLLE